MSLAESGAEAAERLRRHDPTLKIIDVFGNNHIGEELVELVDCLLAHPDVVRTVFLGRNKLTDEMGVKLARYIAASSTVGVLDLSDSQLGETTYLAVAAALRVNSSLKALSLYGNQAVDRARVEGAFVEALRLNPNRPLGSMWRLYSFQRFDVDFYRLNEAARQLGHPSLQLLLALLC